MDQPKPDTYVIKPVRKFWFRYFWKGRIRSYLLIKYYDLYDDPSLGNSAIGGFYERYFKEVGWFLTKEEASDEMDFLKGKERKREH